MMETSSSGSGEGLGGAIPRGCSTTGSWSELNLSGLARFPATLLSPFAPRPPSQANVIQGHPGMTCLPVEVL